MERREERREGGRGESRRRKLSHLQVRRVRVLQVLVEHSYSSLFGTFLMNCEKERNQVCVCVCVCACMGGSEVCDACMQTSDIKQEI